jgi:predicted transcriptional regulator YheO
MNPLLAKYFPLVDFLAEVCGKDTEIVLIDITDMEHSVIAIKNGNISGRTVGSPATNIVLKIMKAGVKGDSAFLANYRGIASDGKILRSSTYFIRDPDDKIIGMLCINIDITKENVIKAFLDNLPRIDSIEKSNVEVEHFKNSVDDIANDSIDTVISGKGLPPSRMSQDEKIAIIRELNNNGVFMLKGSIAQVADKLSVSEATVYRYLNTIKRGV